MVLSQKTANNLWEKVDIARGLAKYDSNEDLTVSDVARRADRLMYENKWEHKKNKEIR